MCTLRYRLIFPPVCLIQGRVRSWQNRKHQEGHSVFGPRGLLPQGRPFVQEQGAGAGTSRVLIEKMQRKKADFHIDKQLSSYLLLLAAATLSWPLCSLSALLFSSPLLPSFLSSCSLLLPLTLSSLPCLLSSLHAQMDGSRSLTRCSTLGRRVSSLCLSVCLSVAPPPPPPLCLIISAVLLTNRQIICQSPCASSFYACFFFNFFTCICLLLLLLSYVFFFCFVFCPTHRCPHPSIHPTHLQYCFPTPSRVFIL